MTERVLDSTSNIPAHSDDNAIIDVLIIGAGISGIGMAAHMQDHLPGKTFRLIEARGDIGGTWDLFRYPGIRSDSDMHTLGYVFEPWREERAIADAPSIMRYLRRIVAQRGIDRAIRLNHKVTRADWSSDDACWTLTISTDDGATKVMRGRFLYFGAGYYDYDEGYQPEFADKAAFQGRIVHPQFWPEDLDYSGKRVVVIGSGATAVTLVPNIAKSAAHVTMLQRTPTWYISRPAEDALANGLRKILPAQWAYRFTRFKNVRMQNLLYKRARKKPDQVGDYLLKGVKKELGPAFAAADYTPPYGPWDQRLCLVPDGDMFRAIRAGKADVVTDRIARFTATGIALQSGRELDADIIVTATGLKLAMAGKVAVHVDGRAVHWPDHQYYKGCMLSGIPNMAVVFGYLNASWTLKADLVSAYVCRVIAHMDATGTAIATPVLSEDTVPADSLFDFSSGYVQRALDQLPKQGRAAPWRMNQDYLADRPIMLKDAVDDGALRFTKAGETASLNAAIMEPAATSV